MSIISTLGHSFEATFLNMICISGPGHGQQQQSFRVLRDWGN